MNIAIDIKAFKNGMTGISRYLRSIMDCLQDLDQENTYYLYECTPSDYKLRNPQWKKRLVPWNGPGIIWQQFILPFSLKKDRIDILWAGEQVCPIFFMGNIRIVTTVYDLAFLHYPGTFRISALLILKTLSPHVIRKSSRLVSISEYIKRDLIKSYHEQDLSAKVLSLPCGKPDWKLPSGYSAEQREPYLFFTGNLEPRKNLINVVLALEKLHARGMKVALRLAGPTGWKNKALHNVIKQSPVRDQIAILDFVSEETLKRNYRECKALIYPSVYEGFGLPILEALCLDCLVLTSKETVMEEIARECALYFNPHNPDSIADTIEMIFHPGFNRNEVLRNRSKILNTYSWRKTAEGLLPIWTSMRS